jgi:amidase
MPLEDDPPRPLSELRFAWSDDFGGIPVSADTHAALAGLAGELAAAGCHVERANPPDFDFQVAMRTYAELYGTMIYATMPPAMRFFMSLMGPIIYRDSFFRLASRRARARAVDYFQTLTRRDQLLRALESFLTGYDAWLCPVASVPAFAHRRPDRLDLPLEVDGQMVPGVDAALAHTLVFNLTGHPVVVLPLAQSAEGLPIGLQVVGRLWGEMPLLNVAQALTEITGPFRRPPGY